MWIKYMFWNLEYKLSQSLFAEFYALAYFLINSLDVKMNATILRTSFVGTFKTLGREYYNFVFLTKTMRNETESLGF